ncbi:hypothetical protein HGRIS_014764 [Hohenbuehelia grisea]|uniref:Caleosin n=1 Tax=Hohenbuehelia grisea TaxID=104357 RepID=A0ABR3IQN4_9AGAR
MSFEASLKQSPELNGKPKHHDKQGPRTNGTTNAHKRTALVKHVEFFDRDGDGIINPFDTFIGFRDIGFGAILSLIAVVVIHGAFSWVTWGWIPDPFFRLKVKNMHRGKHGSDSETYTAEGDFDEKRFTHVFNRYTIAPHTHMSFSEGVRMIHGQRNPFDPFGWFAAAFEWFATYLMLWPHDGRMSKEDVRRVYDGSIFYEISGRSKPTRHD